MKNKCLPLLGYQADVPAFHGSGSGWWVEFEATPQKLGGSLAGSVVGLGGT